VEKRDQGTKITQIFAAAKIWHATKLNRISYVSGEHKAQGGYSTFSAKRARWRIFNFF